MTGGRGRFTVDALALRPGARAPRRQDRLADAPAASPDVPWPPRRRRRCRPHAADECHVGRRLQRRGRTSTSPRGWSRCTRRSRGRRRRRARRGRAGSAARRRCRQDAPRRAGCAGRARRAAPTRARPGSRRCGSRSASASVWSTSAASPRRSGRRAISASSDRRPRAARRSTLASHARRHATREHEVDRPGDPAAPMSGKSTARRTGDVEILGQRRRRRRRRRSGSGRVVGSSHGHARRRSASARRLAASRSSVAEALGQHPGLGDRGHEVGVAVPAGQHVHVQVAGHAGARGPPDVGADVDAVGPVRALERRASRRCTRA